MIGCSLWRDNMLQTVANRRKLLECQSGERCIWGLLNPKKKKLTVFPPTVVRQSALLASGSKLRCDRRSLWLDFCNKTSPSQNMVSKHDTQAELPYHSKIKLIQRKVILRGPRCGLLHQRCFSVFMHPLLKKVPVKASINNWNVFHVHHQWWSELDIALLCLETTNLHHVRRNCRLVLCPKTFGLDALGTNYTTLVASRANCRWWSIVAFACFAPRGCNEPALGAWHAAMLINWFLVESCSMNCISLLCSRGRQTFFPCQISNAKGWMILLEGGGHLAKSFPVDRVQQTCHGAELKPGGHLGRTWESKDLRDHVNTWKKKLSIKLAQTSGKKKKPSQENGPSLESGLLRSSRSTGDTGEFFHLWHNMRSQKEPPNLKHFQ